MDKLDPHHKELALVAAIETEIQIDIRDILNDRLNFIYRLFQEIRDHK
jgi:hypothetical protein